MGTMAVHIENSDLAFIIIFKYLYLKCVLTTLGEVSPYLMCPRI